MINDLNHAGAMGDWTIGANGSDNWLSALLVMHRVQRGVRAWGYKLSFQIIHGLIKDKS